MEPLGRKYRTEDGEQVGGWARLAPSRPDRGELYLASERFAQSAAPIGTRLSNRGILACSTMDQFVEALRFAILHAFGVPHPIPSRLHWAGPDSAKLVIVTLAQPSRVNSIHAPHDARQPLQPRFAPARLQSPAGSRHLCYR